MKPEEEAGTAVLVLIVLVVAIYLLYSNPNLFNTFTLENVNNILSRLGLVKTG